MKTELATVWNLAAIGSRPLGDFGREIHEGKMTASRITYRRTGPPRRKHVLLAGYEHRTHPGVMRYAQEANWVVDMRMAHNGTPLEHWDGDGILALSLVGRPDANHPLRKMRGPIVALAADVDGLATAHVVLNNALIGRMAAEHLLERGLRSLAFYKCTDDTEVRQREAGFAAATKKAGLGYQRLNWHAAARHQPQLDPLDWLMRKLRQLPKPLAVMAQSDDHAYSVITACEAAGLAVPEQVAVVGVENEQGTCDFAPVPITSVDTNREQVGYRGAKLLGRLMDGRTAPATPLVVPPVGIVVRRSSDMLAIDHPEVAAALSFIWQHYHRRIGVADVVRAAGSSRSGLYRAFEQCVGRTVREELERKRIEHARLLLLTSAVKVHSIARACGYASGEQFCRAFVRVTGTTPSEFRRAETIAQTFQTK
jgi:LacI family transcriptional regulator